LASVFDSQDPLVEVADFGPLMRLLQESSANNVLLQALAKRWWDISHTLHITKWEMIVTPHDFH